MDDPQSWIATLLVLAWLAPLAAFTIEVLVGRRLGKLAAFTATGAIAASFVCSLVAFLFWLSAEPDHAAAARETGHIAESAQDHMGEGEAHGAAPAGEAHDAEHGHAEPLGPAPFGHHLYTFASFGTLQLAISCYVDSLTLLMFLMVTFVATLIHIYSIGYMHEELEEYVDHEVTMADGRPLRRPGRFPRFFTYFSLFTFSMLGLVLAGNVFQVFIFWELVGICSYLLIGFYYERKSASTAANKAFIVNRVGDFGFLIGLMILWTSLGTFSFSDTEAGPGIFSQVRAADGHMTLPAGMSYAMLVAAGLGIFCGCVGKSAQFPLHVWLPDAMEGPTPVSALIHAATMVAAGVYLVGRFYPVFTPEVLLVIAYVGCITLFLAATIAIVATDIKRVLAYSTISQLGYMMLGLGVGGWVAGLFHLITHAFFKALLFLCSGSVIHAAHTNEMPKMGGLRHKMPMTFITMLAGVIAISGLAIPGTGIGFSGFYSKDEVLAYALAFGDANAKHYLLYLLPTIGAGITAFYMFRLLFMTFFGKPRDHHVYEHAHESPKVMWIPLAVLAAFSIGVGWGGESWGIPRMLHAQPTPVPDVSLSETPLRYASPSHDQHAFAATVGLSLAFGGGLLAYLFYGTSLLNPEEAKRQFAPIHRFLVQKWCFDELYDWLCVRPTLRVATWFREFDRKVIDGVVDGSAAVTVWFSKWDGRFDHGMVDGLVNLVARWVYATGDFLRVVQTGQLRQYVLFIVVATVGIFMFVFMLVGFTASG